MQDFYFHCPKCNTQYCCADHEKMCVFQCPECKHVFVPADGEQKTDPLCGEKADISVNRSPHRRKYSKNKRHFPFFGILLLCALIAASVFGWKAYSAYKEAQEKARQEIILRQQQREEEERRAREEAARIQNELKRARREAELRRRQEEKKRREAEARRMEEERARREAEQRQKREAELKKRAAEQEAARLRMEAEEKRRREEEEKRRIQQESEARKRAAEQAEKNRRNKTRLRQEFNLLQTLQGQLKIKKDDLERALKREKNSHEICQRKMRKGLHKKKPCTCCDKPLESLTWELYRATRASCCKAYIAAVLQRRKLEEDINELEEKISTTESQIQAIKREMSEEN